MKRFFVAIIATFCLLSAKSYADDDDIVYIPDPAFKDVLLHYREYHFLIDTNHDGEIQYSEAAAVTPTLDIAGLAWEIHDLTGIKAFTSISSLIIEYHKLDHLDLSGMENLEHVVCKNGYYLKTVNLTACINLTTLDLDGNSIKSLNLSGFSKLRVLNCNANDMESLNLLGCYNLDSLICSYNNLEALDLYDFVNLEYINCWSNSIEKLQISNCTKLKDILCLDNKLSKLELPDSKVLSYVSAETNKLTYLNLSHHTNITGLCVENNLLEKLDLRNGNNQKITSLHTYGNPNLKCISVDDPEWSEENWRDTTSYNFEIDDFTEFSEDCSNSVKEEEHSFKIYPNPANSQITIERETIKQADLRIFNMKGQICLSQTIEHGQTQIQIDISKLSNGSYIVEIDNETTSLVISK